MIAYFGKMMLLATSLHFPNRVHAMAYGSCQCSRPNKGAHGSSDSFESEILGEQLDSRDVTPGQLGMKSNDLWARENSGTYRGKEHYLIAFVVSRNIQPHRIRLQQGSFDERWVTLGFQPLASWRSMDLTDCSGATKSLSAPDLAQFCLADEWLEELRTPAAQGYRPLYPPIRRRDYGGDGGGASLENAIWNEHGLESVQRRWPSISWNAASDSLYGRRARRLFCYHAYSSRWSQELGCGHVSDTGT